MRNSPGRPAYKSPEEYYDEILDLKKQIGIYQNDNSTMKSKVRRLEEDNLKKVRVTLDQDSFRNLFSSLYLMKYLKCIRIFNSIEGRKNHVEWGGGGVDVEN